MIRAAAYLARSARWAMTPRTACAAGLGLLLALAVLRSSAAQCSEEPTILMDERTAESHLLAKKDLVLPAGIPELARIRTVVLLVTVDRRGKICALKPVLGPKELQETAVKTVKEHWRYRPFLLDWKPVVAQFPVTVRFALPKGEPRLTALHHVPPGKSGQRKTI